MVRGEILCDALVSVPGESVHVPDGSRVLSFWSTCVRDGLYSFIDFFNIAVFFKHMLYLFVCSTNCV